MAPGWIYDPYFYILQAPEEYKNDLATSVPTLNPTKGWYVTAKLPSDRMYRYLRPPCGTPTLFVSNRIAFDERNCSMLSLLSENAKSDCRGQSAVRQRFWEYITLYTYDAFTKLESKVFYDEGFESSKLGCKTTRDAPQTQKTSNHSYMHRIVNPSTRIGR